LLGTHHGNVAAVGRQLGKARMQIHRWLKRYGIRPEDFR
jgi:transcriptional regulator of acetoin/glycerol metabolism